MFGFSFGEIFIIGAVALVVLGPERLPKVAKTAGLLFGRVQRYVNDVKKDIEREINISDVTKIKDDLQNQVSSLKSTIDENVNSIKKPVDLIDGDIKNSAQALRSSVQDNMTEIANSAKSTTLDSAQVEDSIAKAAHEASGVVSEVSSVAKVASGVAPKSDVPVFDIEQKMVESATIETVELTTPAESKADVVHSNLTTKN